MNELFPIEKAPIETDLPIIVKNEKTILFYDIPLIYYGENNKGDIVLGYWVGYDSALDIERYFHVVISPETLKRYKEKGITLLDILKCHPIFVMDYSPDGTCKIYLMAITDIPDLFLPTERSYYPGE